MKRKPRIFTTECASIRMELKNTHNFFGLRPFTLIYTLRERSLDNKDQYFLRRNQQLAYSTLRRRNVTMPIRLKTAHELQKEKESLKPRIFSAQQTNRYPVPDISLTIRESIAVTERKSIFVMIFVSNPRRNIPKKKTKENGSL